MFSENLIAKLFVLDRRSLGAFRILLGLVAVYRFSLVLYWSESFLAHEGFLPASAISLWDTRWSLVFINHTTIWAQVLALLGLLSSVCFLVGYKTRYSLFALFILSLSFSNRLIGIENNGTRIFNILLFWSLFLPLTRFSVDEFSERIKRHTKESYSSIAVFAFYSQFIIFYFFAGITKVTSNWLYDGLAVYKALMLGPFTEPLGSFLAQQHQLLPYLSMATLIVEVVFPWFLLFEGKYLALRSLAVASFLVLQASFFFVFSLGIFSLVSFVFAIAFIPSRWWSKFSEIEVPTYTSKPIITRSVILLYVIISWWDALHVYPAGSLVPMPEVAKKIAFLPRMEQRWWMFVLNDWSRYWFDVKAETRSGKVVDPWEWFRGASSFEFSLSEPENIKESFSTQPWNRYLHEMHASPIIAQWFQYNLCVRYNMQHPHDPIKNTTVYYTSKPIWGFDSFGEVRSKVLSQWTCK